MLTPSYFLFAPAIGEREMTSALSSDIARSFIFVFTPHPLGVPNARNNDDDDGGHNDSGDDTPENAS